MITLVASEGLKFGMLKRVLLLQENSQNKCVLEKNKCELNVNETMLRHLQGSTAPGLKTTDGVQPFHFWMGKKGPIQEGGLA